MTSKTETAIAALVAVLAAAHAAEPEMLPAPLRNEALPSRLSEVSAAVFMHLNVWDGDTQIDQEMLGADVVEDGYELIHDAAIEFVVAGSTATAREAAFDAGMTAILVAIAADRTLSDKVDTCHVTAIGSKQRELVTEGLPNAKGAEITVRMEFVDSDIR